MSRFIGIRHRVKKTTKGEARPTQVVILEDGKEPIAYDLEDETAELDWLKGEFPVEMRKAEENETLGNFRDHQIDWKTLKKGEEKNHPINLMKKIGKKFALAKKVPRAFDGLLPGDTVGMLSGGSGNVLAYALSRRGQEIGAKVFSISTNRLHDCRRNEDVDKDAMNLAVLAKERIELFVQVSIKERALIALKEKVLLRVDSMKDRVACVQRLIQRARVKIFLSEDGRYPEGKIEERYDEMKANDGVYRALVKEEARNKKEIEEALEQMAVYKEIFEPIEGCGPIIASQIIAYAGDINRFPTMAKFKAYCGVHLWQGGKYGDRDPQLQFPRRKSGETSNWIGELRQAAYQSADQANQRPETYWGQRLLEYKAKFRAKHPEPILVQKVDNKGNPEFNKDGTPKTVKKYSNMHILNMAKWRIATKFIERVYKLMKQLSRELQLEAAVEENKAAA